MAPDLSLAGFRLVIADRAMGLPVLRTLSVCTCCRHYPGAAAGHTLRSASPSRISLPRKGCRVGLRIVLFEDCSAFTRVTACTLALSPIRDTLTRGFSHFVTSMTAPVASGWSVRRVGLAPTGKRRLVTAHTQRDHSKKPYPRQSVSPGGSCNARRTGAPSWTSEVGCGGLASNSMRPHSARIRSTTRSCRGWEPDRQRQCRRAEDRHARQLARRRILPGHGQEMGA